MSLRWIQEAACALPTAETFFCSRVLATGNIATSSIANARMCRYPCVLESLESCQITSNYEFEDVTTLRHSTHAIGLYSNLRFSSDPFQSASLSYANIISMKYCDAKLLFKRAKSQLARIKTNIMETSHSSPLLVTGKRCHARQIQSRASTQAMDKTFKTFIHKTSPCPAWPESSRELDFLRQDSSIASLFVFYQKILALISMPKYLQELSNICRIVENLFTSLRFLLHQYDLPAAERQHSTPVCSRNTLLIGMP